MPFTLEQKQSQFIAELVREFIESIRYAKEVLRHRAPAQQDISQSLANQALNAVSGAASGVMIAGYGVVSPLFIGATVMMNQAYTTRREERYRAVTTPLVMGALEDKIRIAITQAATLLAGMYRDYLQKMEEKHLVIFADCIADRILNYMTKEVTEDSLLDSWKAKTLLLGAFFGRSGRFKQSLINTGLGQQGEKHTWMQYLFNIYHTTVEGLLERGTFATKKDGHDVWQYYVHRQHVRDPFKYGIAVLPWSIATERIKRDYESLSARNIPQDQRDAVIQNKIALVDQLPAIELPLDQQAALLQRQLEQQSVTINALARLVTEFQAKWQQETGEEPMASRLLVDRFVLGQEAQYAALVEAWLDDLSENHVLSRAQWVKTFAELALTDYQRRVDLPLDLAETAVRPVLTDVIHSLTQTKDFFPIQSIDEAEAYRWDNQVLRDYFLALALWAEYQQTKAHTPWQVPPLWETMAFAENQILTAFLIFFLPDGETLTNLFRDWQQATEIHSMLRDNIDNVMRGHEQPCPCGFCANKEQWNKTKKEDNSRVNTAFYRGFAERNHAEEDVRFSDNTLSNEETLHGSHGGFSPAQPNYLRNTSLLIKFSWHWSEAYLTQVYWDQLMESLRVEPEGNDIVAFVPASLNRQLYLSPKKSSADVLKKQLLEDEKRYIEAQLAYLVLEEPGNVDAHRRIATYPEARKIQKVCQEHLQYLAQQERANLPVSQRSLLSSQAFAEQLSDFITVESPLLDKHFLILQNGLNLPSLVRSNSGMFESSITTYSEESVRELHRVDRESRELRDHHIQIEQYRKIHEEVKSIHQRLEERYAEYAKLANGERVEKNWQDTELSLAEIRIFVQACCQALAVRDRIIKNYLLGSRITQSTEGQTLISGIIGFSEEIARRQQRVSTPGVSLASSPDFPSPLMVQAFEQLPQEDSFRGALSVYELLVRVVHLENVEYWAETESRYQQLNELSDAFEALPSEWTFADYKKQLLSILQALPQLQSLLTAGVGNKKSHILAVEIQRWQADMEKRRAEIDRQLAIEQERDQKRIDQKSYHVSSHRFRVEVLIKSIPEMKTAYDELSEATQKRLQVALDEGQLQAVAQWFTYTFEQHRAAMFKRSVIVELRRYFINQYPAYGQNLSENVKQQIDHSLGEGKFAHVFRLMHEGLWTETQQEEYLQWYQETCKKVLWRFADTREVLTKLLDEDEDAFIVSSFNEGDWSFFLEKMKGHWYPLMVQKVLQLLHQGLHPDATDGRETLLDATIKKLFDLSPDLSPAERLSTLKNRAQHVYYLLDCGGQPDWSKLLVTIGEGYDQTKNSRNENDVWLHIAAVMILLEHLENHPTIKATFLGELEQFKVDLSDYYEDFKREEESYFNRMFGKWYRNTAVRENRKNNVATLQGCSDNIPLHFSHFYAYYHFVEELIRHRESQTVSFIDNSRLNRLMNRLLGMFRDLVNKINDWKNWSSLSGSSRSRWRILLRAAPETVEIHTGSVQVVPILHENLKHMSMAEREKQFETKLEQLNERERQLNEKERKLKAENKVEVEDLKEKLAKEQQEKEKFKAQNERLKLQLELVTKSGHQTPFDNIELGNFTNLSTKSQRGFFQNQPEQSVSSEARRCVMS